MKDEKFMEELAEEMMSDLEKEMSDVRSNLMFGLTFNGFSWPKLKKNAKLNFSGSQMLRIHPNSLRDNKYFGKSFCLDGNIKGDEVWIRLTGVRQGGLAGNYAPVIEGTVNGKEVSTNLTKKLFEKYYIIAMLQTEGFVENVARGYLHERERQRIKKEYEKTEEYKMKKELEKKEKVKENDLRWERKREREKCLADSKREEADKYRHLVE